MIVDIHAQGFTVPQALADHMWRRLGLVLMQHNDRMERVSVHVGDENGPRGGVVKFCRIQVHLIGAPAAVIENVGVDLHAVIDRAVNRVGPAVDRNLDRAHALRDAAHPGTGQAGHRHDVQARLHGGIA